MQAKRGNISQEAVGFLTVEYAFSHLSCCLFFKYFKLTIMKVHYKICIFQCKIFWSFLQNIINFVEDRKLRF